MAAPNAPTNVVATAGNQSASVQFTAPDNNGSAITLYTVTAMPGNITQTGSSSPINVTGLTNGTNYTFVVAATNAIGIGSLSIPSNVVKPSPSTLDRYTKQVVYIRQTGNTIVINGINVAETTRVEILDMKGTVRSVINTKGQSELTVNKSSFTTGIYFIKLVGNTKTNIQKLVID
jgi:hypothetical protein